MLREILQQVTATMIHEAPPQMNATVNADMSTDEHHYAPQDTSVHAPRDQTAGGGEPTALSSLSFLHVAPPTRLRQNH